MHSFLKVQTSEKYCENTGVFARNRQKGYIQSFGGNGGELPACMKIYRRMGNS